MKQSFFPWTTLSRYLEEIAKSSDKAPLQSLLLTLFGDGPAALYGPPSVFTFSSHLPSTVYRLLAALNPFRAAFDRQLYLTVLRSHPEAFSLLFADAQTLAAADTYVVGGSGVEMGKTKALINWMLEPRSSTLWLNTIDFLVEVLNLPLALPTRRRRSPSPTRRCSWRPFEPWCWPMSLTRVVGKRRGVERRCA